MTSTNRLRRLAAAVAVIALAAPSASLATGGPPGALSQPTEAAEPCKTHWGPYAPPDCDESVAAASSTSSPGHPRSARDDALAVGGILAGLFGVVWLTTSMTRNRARVRAARAR